MTNPIAPVLRDNLLGTAEAFAEARGSTLDTVSRQAHGDPPFFAKLKAGTCSFTARKYDECMAFFDANWPEGVARPPLTDPRHGRNHPTRKAKSA